MVKDPIGTISKLKKNVTDLFTQIYVEYLLSFKNNVEMIFPSKEILFDFVPLLSSKIDAA